MAITDLIFLLSVLFVFAMAVRIAIFAIRGKWQTVVRSVRFLAIFVALYAVILAGAALALPRRFYAPGERRCFDDWCAAAIDVKATQDTPCGPDNGDRVWMATIEVASVARRIRQRAPDAHAELEDGQGKRYRPCAAAVDGKSLTDELGPGDSIRVALPFRLPPAATPAGVVLHHGDFPGAVIIGADQSFLHRPALQRLGHY